MFGLLILAIIAAIVWTLWTPALSFAKGFRTLLDRPTGSMGLWPFIRGVETVGGEFDSRPTLLVLHHKRGRHSLGYLVVAMQLAGAPGIEEENSGAFREWVGEPAARAAWDELALQHELKLSFEEGWMRALWQPHGLFIFPGRFESERWRRVLRCMRTVIGSLEAGGGRAAHSEA